MHWLYEYKVFLFDFDGLLVNSEKVHFESYKRMCHSHGFTLPWDFLTYCQYAHFNATSLKEEIYALFPELYDKVPTWEILYKEKKEIYLELLQNEPVELMPGVEALLLELKKREAIRCVVTQSHKKWVDCIVQHHPVLQTIPYYITREDFPLPKPDPGCYQIATQRFAKKGESVIGFEDSTKGLTALVQAQIDSVLVSPVLTGEDVNKIRSSLQQPFRFYPSLQQMVQLQDK